MTVCRSCNMESSSTFTRGNESQMYADMWTMQLSDIVHAKNGVRCVTLHIFVSMSVCVMEWAASMHFIVSMYISLCACKEASDMRFASSLSPKGIILENSVDVDVVIAVAVVDEVDVSGVDRPIP